MRAGFGDGLLAAGELNPDVVALCADLTESINLTSFAEQFPDRFFETGVAEQNLIGIAAGLALSGKIPFAASYAAFNPGRSFDQIRVSVAYSQANVKIVGSHGGLSVGPDGATHQMLEDIAMMRALPNMTIVVPADYHEARLATLALASYQGPAYLRLSREATVLLPQTPFMLGKVIQMRSGTDITICANGLMVWEALQAAEQLACEGIYCEVLNVHTVKPLDSARIVGSVRKTGYVITAEEAQINGGLGGAIAELLSEELPVPLKRIGVRDRFGESGTAAELFDTYGLRSGDILQAVKTILKRT